jgi:hypothetical protein
VASTTSRARITHSRWARLARLGHAEVVGDAFEGHEHVVVVVADDGGAGHQPRIVAAETGRDGVDPVVEPVGLGRERAAEVGTLLRQHDPRAAAAGGVRRREPGRPGADDEHVAMQVRFLVSVGVGRARGPAEAGRAPDERLPQRLPGATGTHEGLVVEPRLEERREPLVHGRRIEGEGAAAVLAGRPQAVEQFHLGGAAVGLAPRARAQFHERIRLLLAHRQDAAGAVVLEGPGDEADTVGRQRRGERVALEARERPAVEAKAQTPAAVDPPTTRLQAKRPGHASSAGRSGASCGQPVQCTRWLTVWRTTFTTRRQPPVWCHHSTCQPFGLARP